MALIFNNSSNVWAGSIVDTPHNLSVSGPGLIKSTTEEEICIFCHTPHRARRDIPFLWNREDTTVNYTTYESSTLYASVGQPSGASKMCLSCHDGTIALGALISVPNEIPFVGGIRYMPEGPSKLGTDLSDDHPVSFLYDSSLAISNGELVDPANLPQEVKLEEPGLLQCTSCHDPHDNDHGKFLVMPNAFSALCVTCHDRVGWYSSIHANSSATWNGGGPDPWPHTSYNTVSENGCENCHRPHGAGGHERLLNYLFEEDNCLPCHNGNVASKDIEAELIKTYAHPVQDYVGVHDPTEDFTGPVGIHVECSDCHNPHRTNDTPSPGAPFISGALEGVKGINSSGEPVAEATYLYEVCYKCHGDNNVLSSSDIPRQIQQINVRLEFDQTNPSYHPIENIGRNPNVPSLLQPYNTNSKIFCTDCHNSDDNPNNGGFGPYGPHGSINQYLLERNYSTEDYTIESSYAYALCYKCHDRGSILNDESFSKHKKHVVKKKTPCSVCHDPHGINSSQGTFTNNSHLINFDISIVQPENQTGEIIFEDLGTFTGQCTLRCHGKNHYQKSY
jgi:predicted CXXCH cytochrome family protein